MMLSPFPWPGGKRAMLKDLLPILPPHRAYVEVFSGSAKLLLNKPPSEWELLNDRNGELINFFRVAKHRPAELAEALEAELVHADRFKEFRSLLPAFTVPEIDRAVRFAYLAWYSFGGKQEHFAGGFLDQPSIRRPVDTVREILLKVTERLRRVLIESRDCVQCVDRYDSRETLFFLDPPYVDCSDRVGAYSEMPAEKHEELAGVLKKLRGRFLLTYNDHPRVRELYEGVRKLVVTPISRIYSLAGKTAPALGAQLIITNYDPTSVAGKVAVLIVKCGLGLAIGAATARIWM